MISVYSYEYHMFLFEQVRANVKSVPFHVSSKSHDFIHENSQNSPEKPWTAQISPDKPRILWPFITENTRVNAHLPPKKKVYGP